jgi:hypothetical protein
MMMVLRGTISFKKDPTHKEQGRGKKGNFYTTKKKRKSFCCLLLLYQNTRTSIESALCAAAGDSL